MAKKNKWKNILEVKVDQHIKYLKMRLDLLNSMNAAWDKATKDVNWNLCIVCLKPLNESKGNCINPNH